MVSFAKKEQAEIVKRGKWGVVMSIPVQFPADMLAVDVQMWAISHGLRLKSDGHGNLVAVPVGVNHG